MSVLKKILVLMMAMCILLSNLNVIAEETDTSFYEQEMDRIIAIKPDFEGSYKTVDGVRLPIKMYNSSTNKAV